MTDALTRLADAVEAGKATDADFDATGSRAMYGKHYYAKQAYNGSLDAAKALHEAVLSGWYWERHHKREMVVWNYGVLQSKWGRSDNPDPARAWLLAIIRALAQVQG